MLHCFRSSWDGGTHDVHNSIPAHCKFRPWRLETPDLGLQLVLHVSFLHPSLKLSSVCAHLPKQSISVNLQVTKNSIMNYLWICDSFLQLSLGFFHRLHGILSDHHQQIHQDHPGVQAQAKEHREEPEDQAEAAGLGLSRPGVGYVYQFGPQHSWGTAGPVQFCSQTLQQLRLPGPEWHARAAEWGVLLSVNFSIAKTAPGIQLQSTAAWHCHMLLIYWTWPRILLRPVISRGFR